MAAEYKHKRYYRLRAADVTGNEDGKGGVLKTFSSTSDANTKIGFTSVWNTSSPTKTEALADSDQTLVVTYEFGSLDDQDAFKAAIDAVYSGGSLPFSPADNTDFVEHFKTEWLHVDGSVSDTTNLI